MNMTNKLFFVFILVSIFVPLCYAQGFDESNDKTTTSTYLYTSDSITIQEDETQLEQQRLEKEARFQIEKDIKQNYINQMWAIYSATISLFVDLFLCIFYIIILRLFFVLTFELIPMLITKFVDILEDWFA